MSVNVPLPIDTATAEFDPFATASNPPERTFDLFGMVEVSAWACHLEKGVGKVAFDPTNPNHKRMTNVDIFIQPLPEINVKYPKTCEDHWLAEYATWAKIALPSIKAAYQTATGKEFGTLREINGLWARVTRVASLEKPYPGKDKDGNLTGEMVTKKTMKFLEFYTSEDACRAAAIAANAFDPDKSTSAPAPVVSDPAEAEKTTNFAFLQVIVKQLSTGKSFADAQAAVAQALTTVYAANVGKYYTAESPETVELIGANCIKA